MMMVSSFGIEERWCNFDEEAGKRERRQSRVQQG